MCGQNYQKGISKILLLILAGAVVLLLSSCLEGREEIGLEVIKDNDIEPGISEIALDDILADKEAFSGKDVTVSGKVMPGLAFEFISEQPYRIIQGEALLWVITTDVAPREESFVTVQGTIVSPYQIKGRSYDLVLLEKVRR